MIESPCTRECSFDEQLKVCRGCLRTLKELRAWRTISDAEKQRILDRIELDKNVV